MQMLWASPLTKEDISGIIVMSFASVIKFQSIITPQSMAEAEKTGLSSWILPDAQALVPCISFPNEELQQVVDYAGGGFPLLVKERGRVMTETKSDWADFIIKSVWSVFRLKNGK